MISIVGVGLGLHILNCLWHGTTEHPPGPQGPEGDAGATGSRGPVGTAGAVGPHGPRGDVGPQGATGPQGTMGSQGGIGPQGVVGPQGYTGPRGYVGPKGAIGPQGYTGPRGGIIGIPTSARIGSILNPQKPHKTTVLQEAISNKITPAYDRSSLSRERGGQTMVRKTSESESVLVS